jgi:hypothetical protein
MDRDHEMTDVPSVNQVAEVFRRSRRYLIMVILAAVAFGVGALYIFASQIQKVNEIGSPSYRDSFQRSLLLWQAACISTGAWVTVALWGHFRGLCVPDEPTSRDLLKVAESLRSVWRSVAGSIVFMAILGTFLILWTILSSSRDSGAEFPSAESPLPADARVEFRLAEESQREGLTMAAIENSIDAVYLHSEPVLTNSDISRAQLTHDENEDFAVSVSIAPKAQPRMLRVTTMNRGKRMAILVDDKVLVAPIIKWDISSSAMISGRFTQQEAQRIVDSLNRGHLE